MTSMLSLAAPFALLLPLLGQGAALVQGDEGDAPPAPMSSAPDYDLQPEAPQSPVDDAAQSPLDAFYSGQSAGQVRIEQRVTIRISPYRQSNRNSLLAPLPQRGMASTYEERSMERCVPMSSISGVQTGTGNRLLLFLRDDRIVSINLERACRARDFYSGFYIERSEDGRLCVGRDELQSRSGAKCEIERMRQLVAVEN